MSLSFSSLPTLPDATAIPLPSVSDMSEAVSDVLASALDTASDAATVVVKSARRRPKVAIGVGVAAAVLLLLMLLRRRHADPQQAAQDEVRPRVAAA